MDFNRARQLAQDHPDARLQQKLWPPWTVSTWGLEDAEGFGFYLGPTPWTEDGDASAVPTDPPLLLVERATGKVESTVYLAVRDRVDAMKRVGAWPKDPDF